MKLEVNASLQVLFMAALIAAASSWLLDAVKSSISESPKALQPHYPDYYVKNFSLTMTDKTGILSRRLDGAYMVHYEDDDTSELDRPVLTTYKVDKPNWRIDALTGWVGPDAQLIRLRGDVVMKRYGDSSDAHIGKSNNDLQIKTPALMVFPDTDYAQTDERVVITENSTTIEGIGMTADLKEKRLRLLAQVKGTYAPRN